MIRRLIDLICGGGSAPIYELVDYAPDSGYAGHAACPACKKTQFDLHFSGALLSLTCSACGWFSGVRMGNAVNTAKPLVPLTITP